MVENAYIYLTGPTRQHRICEHHPEEMPGSLSRGTFCSTAWPKLPFNAPRCI